MLQANNNKVFGSSSSRTYETIVNLSRKLTCMPNIRATEKPSFLILNIKKTFNYLRLAFIKALILWHFDLENHIWIKTNVSSYTIGEILSKLNLNSNALSHNLN